MHRSILASKNTPSHQSRSLSRRWRDDDRQKLPNCAGAGGFESALLHPIYIKIAEGYTFLRTWYDLTTTIAVYSYRGFGSCTTLVLIRVPFPIPIPTFETILILPLALVYSIFIFDELRYHEVAARRS
ncbi:hypothetical protein EVAR_64609_1 [Eumeta japonica]|uniref:Uncharacterized protein n=1 Tax=Eumeta variegata TaxID=151549 RepID=A0A4C1ZCB2_EUMVA|nr:hypothetical protein EVAR_64609_1 [Eumeta japonica]